jgi:hypothetical protein
VHFGKRRAEIARRWQDPRILGATALHSELKRAVYQFFQESLIRTVGILTTQSRSRALVSCCK